MTSKSSCHGDANAVPGLTTFPGSVTLIKYPDQPLPLIFSSAVIGHGNSGGPLLNLCAQAIGMNTLGWSGKAEDTGYKINVAQGGRALSAFLDAKGIAHETSALACSPADQVALERPPSGKRACCRDAPARPAPDDRARAMAILLTSGNPLGLKALGSGGRTAVAAYEQIARGRCANRCPPEHAALLAEPNRRTSTIDWFTTFDADGSPGRLADAADGAKTAGPRPARVARARHPGSGGGPAEVGPPGRADPRRHARPWRSRSPTRRPCSSSASSRS